MKVSWILWVMSIVLCSTIARGSEHEVYPVLVWREQESWDAVWRMNTENVILYNNQEIIFRNPRGTPSVFAPYLHVTLYDYEYQNLIEYLGLSEEFRELQSLYKLENVRDSVIHKLTLYFSHWSKDITMYGSLQKPYLPKDIGAITETVYQQLRDSCVSQQEVVTALKFAVHETFQGESPSEFVNVCGIELEFLHAYVATRHIRDVIAYYEAKEKCPEQILRLVETLDDYDHLRAEPWFPDTMEIILWPQEIDHQQAGNWPAKWPDLYDVHTQRKESNRYSLFLRTTEWKEFVMFLLQYNNTARINGKTWTISYRFPFPQEDIWEKKKEESPQ